MPVLDTFSSPWGLTIVDPCAMLAGFGVQIRLRSSVIRTAVA